jgi:hypothetical protein
MSAGLLCRRPGLSFVFTILFATPTEVEMSVPPRHGLLALLAQGCYVALRRLIQGQQIGY